MVIPGDFGGGGGRCRLHWPHSRCDRSYGFLPSELGFNLRCLPVQSLLRFFAVLEFNLRCLFLRVLWLCPAAIHTAGDSDGWGSYINGSDPLAFR